MTLPADGPGLTTAEDTTAGPTGSEEPPAISRRMGMGIAAALLALVIAACAGLLIGATIGGSSPPGTDSVDAGFARDMQVHHTQAVEMAYAVTLATEDVAVRQVAFDIMTTQQAQIGRMSGWLEEWRLPAYTSEPVMAWMGDSGSSGGHGGHDTAEDEDAAESVAQDDVLMPGMATDDELERLRDSTGREAEVLFLQLMIDHHRGGVDMAEYAAERAAEPEVRLLADRMATSQEAEIQAMNDMLVERGADPV